MGYEPTKADWDKIWENAGMLKQFAGSGTVVYGIRGRFISTLVKKLLDFWDRHQDTLVPVLSQIAIAALQALAAARPSFESINTPGPE